ncbi:MAG TPA: hypothetical protein VL201_04295 [Patescibacteria group bacterium]|jgi:hypothetical protein|nr:hypothetical protein [Patescibacteria group bacterium]
MLYILVNDIPLQATEMLRGLIEILPTQKETSRNISDDHVFRKIPNELLMHIIDIHYHENERFLIVSRLRLVNKFLYLATEHYFNTFHKQVPVYKYLKEQDAYFLNECNLYRSFTKQSTSEKSISQESISKLYKFFNVKFRSEQFISQESIILITKLPGIDIKTTIHFSLKLEDSKWWHLIFSTVYDKKRVEKKVYSSIIRKFKHFTWL